MSSSPSDVKPQSVIADDFKVLEQSLLIRAGAGAGKTTLLIKTFIQLCDEFQRKNKKFPRVAITTFTRKATQEVKERLSVKAIETGNQKLFHHINKKSSVHISTIHGLLTLFVQENADMIGLPQNIKILDQNVNKKNLRRTIRNCLKESPDFLEILEHYSFVRLVDLVVDGLDSLKQSQFLAPVSSAELTGLSSEKISNLQQQLKDVLDFEREIPDSWIEYFSYLKQLLVVLEEKNVEIILDSLELEPTKPRWNKKKPAFSEIGHELLENFWKDFDLSVADTEKYFQMHEQLNVLFLKLIQQVFEIDQVRKRQTGQITINDLELFSLQLVRQQPDAATSFSKQFDYYMIDEFQDTSPIQVEILEAIIGDKPHFIVGDPQQSIYLFRGARSEVFLEKQKAAAENIDNLKLHFLDTNYRSQPSLMAFINDYFSHMSSQFEPMKTNPNKEVLRTKIHFIESENESAAALQHITELLKENISPKDICVLSRKNSNLMSIASLAQQQNIPVQLQMSAGFDRKREILDLISILKFLVNPHDNENLVLLLRSPWAYLSDQDIAKHSAKQCSLWNSLNRQANLFPSIIKLNSYHSDYQKLGVSEALIVFVKQCGFLDFSAAYDVSGKREANFWKFFVHLKAAEASTGFSLNGYLSESFHFLQSDLGSSQSEAIPVSQPDRVNLMTIHASKGLEFPYVVVVGCAEAPLLTLHMPFAVQLIQNKFSLAPLVVAEGKVVSSRWTQNLRKDFNRKEIEEHERLLYVAMTRAQNGLALIAEDRSRKASSSWKHKSFWPEHGINAHEHYDLHSSKVTADLTPRNAEVTTSSIIRGRLQAIAKKVTHQSVTESLNAESVSPSITDYTSKVFDLLKAKKGTDMHRLFESLQIMTQNPSLSKSITENLKGEQKESVNYLMQLKDFPLAQLVKNGFPEWGFGIKTKNGVLQGQIDLWGECDNQIYILDYKTGSTGYAEKAFQQLSFYSFCLYKMNLLDKTNKINLVVTYPLEQKTLIRTFDSYDIFLDSVSETILKLF